ncbi:hypothetical protein M011DRAFT_480928 [Sporormia fimetaria CBS 119925]|uniref:Uncharacterized protein n=1 Tax=Sporormia fimetaria CBS 119925 TaxID=1340428 RepID=A0A6A6V2D1_9PLEO|nr:hypothetical protein M011DRAFT_480928 [Sporormia fimetaria CBS 119925]
MSFTKPSLRKNTLPLLFIAMRQPRQPAEMGEHHTPIVKLENTSSSPAAMATPEPSRKRARSSYVAPALEAINRVLSNRNPSDSAAPATAHQNNAENRQPTTVNQTIESEVPFPGYIYLISVASTGDLLTVRLGDLNISCPSTGRDSANRWILADKDFRYHLRNWASGDWIVAGEC